MEFTPRPGRGAGETFAFMIEKLASLFDHRPRTAEGWLARMGRPRVGARDQDAFLSWLEEDEDHLRQYEQAKADRAALGGLSGAFDTQLSRLRAGKVARPPRRWVAAGGLAVAGLAAVVLVAPQFMSSAVEVQTYASAPGRITDVELADGSRVALDADSMIEVALDGDARRVTLVRGAAFFDVAHDAARPFQVAVSDRRVIVTGTKFEAALSRNGGEVSLLEGRVSIGLRDVGSRRALAGATALRPGDKAAFSTGVSGETLSHADVETATAWRKRRLVFRDAPLAEVVAAVGRYSDRPLIADDPRLDAVRVTAVLPLEGEGALIERMDELLPISVESLPQGGVRIRAD